MRISESQLRRIVRSIMLESTKILVAEGLDDTSWTGSSGATVTLRQLLDFSKNLPVEELDVKELAKKKKILGWGDDPIELAKIDKADLQYPILVFVNDAEEIMWIVDGNHRAQKALKLKIPKISAKLIKTSSMPPEWQEIFGV